MSVDLGLTSGDGSYRFRKVLHLSHYVLQACNMQNPIKYFISNAFLKSNFEVMRTNLMTIFLLAMNISCITGSLLLKNSCMLLLFY